MWSRVLAVCPLNDGDSGNGKIVHLEQPGEPTRIWPTLCRHSLDIHEPAPIHNSNSLGCPAGSGCYIGTRTLIEALRELGIEVALITPGIITPMYSATRVLFNETLRWRHLGGDATIGIDVDGYAIAGTPAGLPHVACIKGVLGDAVRFERGATRVSMAFQARLEARHARRADRVITVSQYCARRIEELYRVKDVVVVPELIDLRGWRQSFQSNPAVPDPRKFTVLSVCRFYPRKRLNVLLQAVALLRDRLPR